MCFFVAARAVGVPARLRASALNSGVFCSVRVERGAVEVGRVVDVSISVPPRKRSHGRRGDTSARVARCA